MSKGIKSEKFVLVTYEPEKAYLTTRGGLGKSLNFARLFDTLNDACIGRDNSKLSVKFYARKLMVVEWDEDLELAP